VLWARWLLGADAGRYQSRLMHVLSCGCLGHFIFSELDEIIAAMWELPDIRRVATHDSMQNGDALK